MRTADLVGRRVDRFLINARLGGGGMGEVFLAEDTLLKRPVAMKVIRCAQNQEAQYRRRLITEAERACQLNNEHVARIYDVLEQENQLFLVMEYVTGETLRQRLSGPLSLHDFFDIAEQCLAGLGAAHQHGILHCDLKPENMMITPEGVVKILDFGLARRVASDTTLDTTSTVRGGTPGYMAPEIVFGSTPDQSADIFSLGVVLYEALAGCHPFSRSSVLPPGDAPPPIARELPPGLEQVVARMLARDPARRYASCGEASAALRAVREGRKPAGVLTGIQRSRLRAASRYTFPALILLALLLWPVLSREPQPSLVEASSRQLAVLPFQPADENDANSRAFAAGLTDTLSAKLGQISDRYPLQIIDPYEVRKQNVHDARSARNLLGATMALNGTLQRAGGTVRVAYTLVDTRSLRQTHSGVITADASDAFAVQDRVIQEVLSGLDIELAKEDRQNMVSQGTARGEAYSDYLRGRGYMQDYSRRENVENAVSAFERSIKADPNFALAWAGLGRAQVQMYLLTRTPESVARANEACSRSAALDPGSPDAEICMGTLLNVTGKYEQAVQHLQRALELDGSRDEAYRELSLAFDKLHRPADAESLLKRAIALRPQYWPGYQWLGWFYYDHGRNAEAVEQFKREVAMAPDSAAGYSNLGGIYVLQGNYPDGISALEKSIAIQPTASALSNLGATYFYLHRYSEAAQIYARAVALHPRSHVIYGNLGEAYAQVKGKRQEGRDAYAHALKLAEEQLAVNPRDAKLRLNAALYAARLGQREKAEKYRASGLKLSSRDPQALHGSALVFAELHQDRQALSELSRALRAGLSRSEITDNPAWQRFSQQPEYKAIMHTQGKK
ncbi:MAG: protein kinase domain-containing protein [Actinomycetota bacterium]